MKSIGMVFFGAALGGVLRFTLGSFIYSLTGREFPWGTLIINLTGSFIMGFLYVIINNKFTNLAPYLAEFVLVGILGGYTTFSSFSIETLNLLQDGKITYALLNIITSTVLGVLLAWLGVILANKFI